MKNKSVVLTFDDAVKNHLDYVAPLLKTLGFDATFFICRPAPKWGVEAAEQMLDEAGIAALAKFCFELGNHTLYHTLQDDCEAEIAQVNELFKKLNIASPTSFAYPGGRFAEHAVPIIRKYGMKCARIAANEAWKISPTDPMAIPAWNINDSEGKAEQLFHSALESAKNPDEIPVLIFHGIPDLAHPWVTTPPEKFASFMRYLADNDYEVLSLRSACERFGI